MNTHFDCPNQAGVMCKNLDDINAMVDRGAIKTSGSQPAINHDSLEFTAYPDQQIPKRNNKSIQKIWVAPFKDNEGNYIGEHYLYTVVKNTH